MSRHGAWYAVVAVEELPPQELISGDGLPLSAGQTGSQHGIVGQTQEDLQHQAVWQDWDTLHPDILLHGADRYTHTHRDNKGGVVAASALSLHSFFFYTSFQRVLLSFAC